MDNDKPNDWREALRLRAFELSQQGWTGKAIAEALGTSRSAVSQWLQRARRSGREALRSRKGTGRPPTLSPEQLQRLPELLAKGPAHFGFRGELWTRSRVGEVIRREFGVRYHESHVGRLLKRLRWSPQKPAFRAAQRNEQAIAAWKEHDWDRIKKKRSRKAE